MEKRYQVFISSTYADLKEERSKVIQTIMELDCIPAGMEIFPAIDEEQFNFIKRVIDDCDYYLLIIGGRYGTVSQDGFSYTEKEFDYAVEKGIRVIAFIHGSPDTIPIGKSEKDEDLRQKLEIFKLKVSSERLIKYWSTADQLPGLVALSLSKTIKTYPAVGWVRGNNILSTEMSEELVQLTKENRILKEQITEFAAASTTRKPELKISVNNLDKIELKIKKQVVREWDLLRYCKKENVPGNVLKTLTPNYIDDYNLSIKDNLELANKYNNDIVIYKRLDGQLPLQLKIINSGQIKVNDIHVDIIIPKGLLVFANKDIPHKPPAKPKNILLHPFHKAFEVRPLLNMSIIDSIDLGFSAQALQLQPFNNEKWSNVKNNNITLYRKSLLHTRSSNYLDEFTIVPMKAGEYKIMVRWICEEMPTAQKKIIHVLVTEE